PRRVEGQREGADGDDHGVTGADLGELLRPRRRLDQKRRDQLVLAHRVALGPGEELADRDSARSRRGGELDFRVRREERRMSVAGRRWSRLISTMTSVPPAMGTASGCAAFIARASSHVAGWRNSITRPWEPRARRRG